MTQRSDGTPHTVLASAGVEPESTRPAPAAAAARAPSRAPSLERRPRNDSDEVSISFAQSRLWFLDQMGAGAAFNVPLAARLKGPLDLDCLTRTFDAFVRRHEGLRTSFPAVDGRPVGRVSPLSRIHLERRVLQPNPEGSEAEALRLLLEDAMQPFDLSSDPLVRAVVVPLGENGEDDCHALLMTMHHIVWDTWSTGLFFRELSVLYDAFSNGEASPLEELNFHYSDFASWQRDWLRGEALEEQMAFWRRQLEGIGTLDLPTDRPRPMMQGYETAVHDFDFPSAIADGVRELANREGMTLAMLMLGVWQTFLMRYSGQTDIAVGLPVANRSRIEFEPIVGDFVNTLVMRSDLSGDPTFRELLKRVRSTAIAAFEHGSFPFDLLVRELNPRRDPSRHPLFEAMFALQNVRQEPLRIGPLEVDPLGARDGSPEMQRPETIQIAVDLELRVIEHPDGLVARLIYDAELFDASTVERMQRHLLALLEGVLEDPETRLSRLPLMDPTERHRLLTDWNDTALDFGETQGVHQLFEEQALRTPEAIALISGDAELSFRELDLRADRLARSLAARGVRQGSVVGVYLERSMESIVAILATLKAGGAYTPLDPSHPKDRLAFLLKDTAAPVIVTQERWLPTLPEYGGAVLCLDSETDSTETESTDPLDRVGEPTTADDPLYVMYTSGSTGRPKGVVGLHRGIVNRLLWEQSEAPWQPGDVACHKTNLGFVDSVNEIFSPLCAGVPIVVAPDEVVRSATDFVALLAERGVTRTVFTPSHLAAFLEVVETLDASLPRLAYWMVSGERLPWALANRILTLFPDARLWNVYGSTEVSADATAYEVDRDSLRSSGGPFDRQFGDVPIGRPLSNVRTYLLDDTLQPVPIGLPGELCVAGAGVARGYWKRPQLSSQSFPSDPFAGLSGSQSASIGSASSPLGDRLYRTGDLARYREDGALEYLGRLDSQVKVRGMRVELGEIEAVLGSHPELATAVAVVRTEVAGDQRIVCYGVPESVGVSEADLMEFARSKLPVFMLPAQIVLIETLPKTPSGKIDRRALPAPSRTERSRFEEPTTPTERTIASIWSELLSVDRVSRSDQFVDLGGHSLLAMVALAKMQEALDAKLRPADLLFANLAQIAAVCDGGAAVDDDSEPNESWLSRMTRPFRAN